MTTRMMHVMPRRGRIRPAPSPAELRRVPIDQIDVPPRRLRRDLGDIDSLAASLGTFGQLAPVVCYTGADGRLRLIAGERRLEATRRLHAARGSAPEIDVLVRTLAPNQAPVELELIENAQRRELSDAEEADAFIQLTSQLGRRLQAVADISGRSVAYVSKRIRLFEDAELRAAIEAGEIATSQAEELLALPESVRGELLARSISQEWTHDRMRAEVRRVAQATDDTMSTRAGASATGSDATHPRPGVLWSIGFGRTAQPVRPQRSADRLSPRRNINGHVRILVTKKSS